MIAMRGIYNDDCKRQHIRWCLAETWRKLSRHKVVYMIVHIHVMKEKRTKSKPSSKKGTFAGNKVSYMDIDGKE
jgi:hypothetical protein